MWMWLASTAHDFKIQQEHHFLNTGAASVCVGDPEWKLLLFKMLATIFTQLEQVMYSGIPWDGSIPLHGHFVRMVSVCFSCIVVKGFIYLFICHQLEVEWKLWFPVMLDIVLHSPNYLTFYIPIGKIISMLPWKCHLVHKTCSGLHLSISKGLLIWCGLAPGFFSHWKYWNLFLISCFLMAFLESIL